MEIINGKHKQLTPRNHGMIGRNTVTTSIHPTAIMAFGNCHSGLRPGIQCKQPGLDPESSVNNQVVSKENASWIPGLSPE